MYQYLFTITSNNVAANPAVLMAIFRNLVLIIPTDIWPSGAGLFDLMPADRMSFQSDFSHSVLIAGLDGKDGQGVLHRVDPLLDCQLCRSVSGLQQQSALGAPRTGAVRHAIQAFQLPRPEIPLQLDGEWETDRGLDGREKLLSKTV